MLNKPGSSCASRVTSANVRSRLGGGPGGCTGVLPGAPARRCALAIAMGDVAAVTAATASFVGGADTGAHPARGIADAGAVALARRKFMVVLLLSKQRAPGAPEPKG